MKDLTEGPIGRHLLSVAAPLAVAMLAQLALQLVDLYFVTRLGVSATAGVNAAGNVVFVTIAVNQVLGIGTGVAVAHAVGRKNHDDVRLLLNQSLTLSIVCAVTAVMLIGFIARPYLETISADSATVDAGMKFLLWVLPGYALTFPMTVLAAALRGAGVVAQAVAFNLLVVMINMLLAPVLIAKEALGLGVKGAGLATSISILIGFIAFIVYCKRAQSWMTLHTRLMIPCIGQWKRIMVIGFPAGCDFGLFFFFTAAVYYAIRDFGVAAQAGFAIGSQVLQVLAFPGMAVAYAAGPVAGQNFGARKCERVRETFRKSAFSGVAAMVTAILLVQWQSRVILELFDAEEAAIVAATEFLRLGSWALVAQVLVSTCSSMFQGLGYTVPSLISSGARLITFLVPIAWLSLQATYVIEQVWYLLVGSLVFQASVSLILVASQFRRCLPVERLRTHAPVGR